MGFVLAPDLGTDKVCHFLVGYWSSWFSIGINFIVRAGHIRSFSRREKCHNYCYFSMLCEEAEGIRKVVTTIEQLVRARVVFSASFTNAQVALGEKRPPRESPGGRLPSAAGRPDKAP